MTSHAVAYPADEESIQTVFSRGQRKGAATPHANSS